MRYPLVDGQGNFGSVDGDPPAAERYTEVRMTEIAEELLADLEKETVELGPNYDETRQMALVLPGKVPNLLINGAAGIAVGMATNIPPHNFCEIVDGLKLLLDKPAATAEEISKVVTGPDFPTGGIIYGRAGIREAYATGRGKITLRARATIETQKSGKMSVIVNEIPYQTNKASIIEKIADLVRDGKLEGISDIRDESDQEGMRIVIELKRDAYPKVVLNQLFAHTQLQVTFGIIMLALDKMRPVVMNLKELMERFLAHREEVITRRTKYDLARAEERAHILEGYKIALDHIDEIVQLIKKSASPDEARKGLMKTFKLSEIQAQAILDMRLQRLTGLERKKIEDEYLELIKKIEYYALDPREPHAAPRNHPRRARRPQHPLRRRAPDRDRRPGGGVPDRGSDRRREHGHHDHPRRLHQAHPDRDVPAPAPRRERRLRDGHEGRGLHRASLHRLDAQLHPLLHRQGAVLLGEGARDSAGRAPRPRQGDREPPRDVARREDHRLRPRERFQTGRLSHARDEGRLHQEDAYLRLREPAARRHHRGDPPRGGRASSRRSSPRGATTSSSRSARGRLSGSARRTSATWDARPRA